MASWFSSLQAQAQSLSEEISGQVNRVTTQVVENLQKAQTDLDSEAAQLAAQESNSRPKDGSRLLPWEMVTGDSDSGEVVVVPGLMEKILALSLEEATFEAEVPQAFSEHFELMAEISVIERLLDLDPNLSAMQARHSATMDEERFWCAYFYQCEQLKIECLTDAEYEKVQGPAAPANPEDTVSGLQGAEDEEAAEVDDDELEAAIEAELMADEQASEKMTKATSGEDDLFEDEDIEEDAEISSGEIINVEDEFDDDELEAQIAAELGDEDD
mmetsp:Transcript_19589/g.74128  ORF Transcript_19589/g.74128 Transcript_19589/m.74128 type:complete len:272 (-) Transcript_19589:1643-2458(-)|eukprot:scaffold1954_cov268-Pinguiococcus_pyrenoidosus.AAC.116